MQKKLKSTGAENSQDLREIDPWLDQTLNLDRGISISTSEDGINWSKAKRINVVDVAGSVEGVFIGVTHQLWYSRKKQSTDLFFYVTDKGRGWGSSLLRAYIRWARTNKGVAEITLGITSGIGDMNRTRQLYERMGAIKIGDSFIFPQGGIDGRNS